MDVVGSAGMGRIACIVLGLSLFPGVAAAQEEGDVDATRAIADTTAVAQRLAGEIRCVRAKQRSLERTVELLEEARQQMRRGTTDRARNDARDAIRSLRQRAVELEREALECRTEPSDAARSDAPVGGVVYRDPPSDPTAERVAEPNPATRVFERDTLLRTHVHAVVGEQVDGHGRLEQQAVRTAIRGIAGRLSRCYDGLVDRGALQRGRIILAIHVSRSGRSTRVRTERSTIRSAVFQRCVRAAGRTFRVSPPPEGGESVVSYTLRFAP